MGSRKTLFIDRDGTLIHEPEDQQIDSLKKLSLIPNVISCLLDLRDAGYRFVMVTNQDGLGTSSFPQADFDEAHQAMIGIFTSQGIQFDEVLICPHRPADNCLCRKPHLGLVRKFLSSGEIDLTRSAVIGDRDTDLLLAQNMGIQGFKLNPTNSGWKEITRTLLSAPRRAKLSRKTNETLVEVEVELDAEGRARVGTGIAYFDHMLEQLAKHGGMNLDISVKGDLHVDEHHTVEDTAWVLGDAILQAVGDKVGISRYGFVLPMDETLARAQVAMDLSGRPFFSFKGNIPREKVGELPVEMVPHFFRTLSDRMGLTLHMEVSGENAHHMVESLFKAFARALKGSVTKVSGAGLPSTKGTL